MPGRSRGRRHGPARGTRRCVAGRGCGALDRSSPTAGCLGPGVEVTGQQPGDDLRLCRRVEVTQVQRVALTVRALTILLGRAERDGVPDAVSCFPGHARPPPSLSGPGGCAVQVLRLPLHGTPGPKGRPRNDREEDAGVAGSRAHARSRQEITKKMADQKMRVVCVAAIRVDGLWPGWG